MVRIGAAPETTCCVRAKVVLATRAPLVGLTLTIRKDSVPSEQQLAEVVVLLVVCLVMSSASDESEFGLRAAVK